MKIVYTPKFDANIIEIKNYLKANHPVYTKSTLLRIKQRTKDILKNPYLGRVGRTYGTREIFFNKLPYCMVYKINPNKQEIVLLKIFHTSQNYP
ncbi:MAG: type II toxin-antitoxin system RelE/ParE family toxin [Alphaproteobacteria bacterium]|jgi:plasmid stabilization system protein ParE|nr:type II toxin-antitoxin system RelE/ParE family toxin [Alphaproteobacteria bacterium]